MIRDFVVCCLIIAACSWSLFIPGLNAGHDNNHLARIYEMTIALKEGVFPVIWSQNLNFGFGMPIFEFYAPLPYYFGAVINLVTNDLVLAVKLTEFMANLLIVISIGLVSKLIFTNRQAVLVAVAATALAPYRAVDLYVRTAVSESWAIAFLPFVLWGVIKTIKQSKWGIVAVSLSVAGLVLSHNLTAIMALPILAFFGLAYLWIQPYTSKTKISLLIKLLWGGLLGIGLAAFYVLPIIKEKNYIQLDKYVLSEYYDYRQHFLYLRQFIKPWGVWEYGGSGWGPNDEMSYFLGFGQLLILIIASFQLVRATLQSLFRRSPLKQIIKIQVLSMVFIFVVLLLTLLKMQFLWDLLSFFKYIQFPWRFLSVALVFIGLTGGIVIESTDNRWIRNGLFVLLISLIIGSNYRYFRSEKYFDNSQQIQNYETVVRGDISTNLYDYVPTKIDFLKKTGFYVYKDPTVTDLIVPSQSLVNYSKTTTKTISVINNQSIYKRVLVKQPIASSVNFNLAYYPGWSAIINNKFTEVKSDLHGLIYVDLPAGESNIELVLKDTNIRFMGKIISLISLGILITIIVFKKSVIHSSHVR